MKILYIAPMDSIHSRRWISHFKGLGHEVQIIDSAATSIREFEGSLVHQIQPGTGLPRFISRFLGMGRAIRHTRDVVAEFKPDVLHLHWMAGFNAYAASRVGFHPLISTPWGSDILVQTRKSLWRRTVARKVVRASDAFCCDAVHLVDRLMELGANLSDAEVVYFGTDVKLFKPEARDPQLAKELGVGSRTAIVLSNRALKSIYDVETLVRAAPKTVEQVSEVAFVIVGDGDEKPRLQQLARELGVEGRLRFVGRLSDDDMVRFTASASVYVSTALSDGGLAASTAEAMACGVPCVITDFGENRDWVENGAAGFVFPARDSDALADRLVGLLADEQLRSRIGSRAVEVIRDRNNRHKEMKRVEEIYRRVSSPRPTSLGGPA